jgi:hypothetical protein
LVVIKTITEAAKIDKLHKTSGESDPAVLNKKYGIHKIEEVKSYPMMPPQGTNSELS